MSDETPWTPGPWEIRPWTPQEGRISIAHNVVDTDEGRTRATWICEVGVGTQDQTMGQKVANARLIGAAPDMVELLERIRGIDDSDDCLPGGVRNKLDTLLTEIKGDE